MKRQTIIRLFVFTACCPLALTARAGQDNIAPLAHATVSSVLNEAYGAENINDGRIMYDGSGEWACKGFVPAWGVMDMPWAQLEWDNEVSIDRVVLYDRVSQVEHTAGGTLHFSDGTAVSVTEIPNDGSARSVTFAPKQ